MTTGDIKRIATAKRALGMANHLSDLGWKIDVIMEDTEENRHRTKMECNDAINIVFFPNCTSATKEVKTKSALVKKLRPDYVYLCAFVFRNVISTPAGCKRLVEHSELASAIKDSKFIKKILNWGLEYYSVIYSDGLINASQYLQSVYKKKARRLFLGARPMLYSPYAYSETVCQTQADVAHLPVKKEGNNRFFVFLGSLSRNYGAFTMIEAFEKIHQTAPQCHLLLLGKGPDYPSVVEYIRAHKLEEYVHALGFVEEEDIASYFTLADAFVSPMNNTVQDWARCPSKLYMYLPYQKPVITCKIGEPLYTLGEEGVYFEPSSVQSLSEAILHTVGRNQWHINIDPLKHEWKYRTRQFHQWVEETFR